MQPATFARFVPEREDDFAWENDKVAFRTYGPALRNKGVNSGIDCWLKRVDYPIINKWYKQAQEGMSYHEDHGEGLDNYHVGSSAGCGGTGIWLNGKRKHLDTFTAHKLIESTAERTVFELTYEREIEGVTYGEVKTFTIELGKRLFKVDSVFTQDGEPASKLPICIGVATHDSKGEAFSDQDKGWIAVWEAFGGSELGTAARIAPERINSIKIVDGKAKDDGHIFIITTTDENGKLSYEAGYGWKKAEEIRNKQDWIDYLNQ